MGGGDATAVTNINVAYGLGTSGYATTGLIDLAGHSSDILATTISIGGNSGGSGTPGHKTGTFTFDTGSLVATTVNLGSRTGGFQIANAITGTLNLMASGGSGTATFTNLTMGLNSSSSTTSNGASVATLNIGGGTVGITGTLTMGNNSIVGTTAQTVAPVQATTNISGGTVTIGTLNMNLNSAANSGTNRASVAALNITGGTTEIAALSLANTSTGTAIATSTLSITAGTLTLGADLAYTRTLGTVNSTLTLNGGTLDMSDKAIGVAGALIGTLNLQSGTLKNVNQINAGGGFAKTAGAGTNTLVIDGTNSFSGAFTISSGTVQVGAGSTSGTLGTVSVTNNGALTFNRSNAASFSNDITGSGTVTQAGSGTLTLSGANGYDGLTSVNAGILSVSHATALGSLVAGTTVGANASLELLGGITVGAEALGLSGTGSASNGALRNLSGNNSFGGTVTLNADATIQSDANTLTLGNATAVAAGTRALTFAGQGNITVSGAITGSSVTLTKAGSGVLALSGANTYLGTTEITAGTLQVGTAGTSGALGSGTVTIGAGATLAFNRNDVGGVTWSNDISGAGTLSMLATSNILTLSGNNTGFTGAIVVSSGALTLSVASSANLGNPSSITIRTNSKLQTTGDVTTSAAISLEGANTGFSPATGTTLTVNGVLTYPAVVGADPRNNGAGTLVLNNSGNTFAANSVWLMSAGTLKLGHAAALNGATLKYNGGTALDNASGADMTLTGVTGLQLTSGFAFTGTNSLSIGGDTSFVQTANSTRTITVTANSLDIGGILSTGTDVTGTARVNGALTKAGAGILILSGDSDYTGVTTVSAGILQVGVGSTSGSFGSGNVTNNATIRFNRSDALTVSNTIAGSGGIIQSGSGSLALTAGNGFSGVTTLESGTLRGGSDTAFGTSALTLNAGTLTSDGATARTFANNVTVGGNITLGAASTFTGVLTFNGTVGLGSAVRTMTVNSDVTFAGIVSGTSDGGLTKAGNGTLTLSGANDFAGATSITAGALATTGSGILSTTSGVTLANGTTLSLGGDETINSLANGGTVTIALGKALTTGSSDYSLSGIVTGDGSLTKAGAGTLTLSSGGTFSFAGLTTVTGGTLAYGASDQLANAITVSGGILALAGFSDTVGAVTLTSGSITGASGVLTSSGITVDTATTAALSAKLGGATTLAMTGAGVLTVSGDNTFSGGTTISAGTVRAGHENAFGNLAAHALALNGGTLTSDGATARAFANNVTVGGNITLGATTTNTGVLTFNGTVGLGAATRTLTVNSDVTLAGIISDGGLIKLGNGILTLSGNNSFTLGTTITNGTITIGHASSLGAGTVNVGALGTLDLNNFTIGNTIVLAEGATLTGGQVSASTAPTTGTLAVELTGTQPLEKTDSGRLELTGANSYTGATSVTGGGTIAVADFGNGSTASPLGVTALTDPDKLVIGGGATLEFTGATDVSTARSFTIAGSATIAATGAGGLTFNSSSVLKLTGTDPALTLEASSATAVNYFKPTLEVGSPAIATLTIDGTGQWVIGSSATNRFKGTASINVDGGSLGFESGSLGTGSGYSGSAIRVSNNTVLVWSGANTDDISARLQVPAGAAAKLDMGSNVVEFNSAPTMGAGASLSVTSGTLKVTAAASGLNFTGTTGKLSINGTVGSVGLSTGGTLGGSGTVGAVTTATGSHLSPGNSPGTLNMASLTLAAGTIIDWQVQDALDFTGPELGFDTIHITGNLDVTAVTNSSQRIVIKVASLLGNGNGTTLGAPLNFNNADTPGMMPRTFDFMRVDGAISFAAGKSISDIFSFDLNDFVYTNGGSNNYGLWSVSSYDSGGDTYIRITAVPEPSTYGFGLGALALAAAAIRRRRKNQPKV